MLIKKYMFFLRVRAHVCACNVLYLLKEYSLYARAKSNIYLLNKKNLLKVVYLLKSVPYMLKVYFFMLNSL